MTSKCTEQELADKISISLSDSLPMDLTYCNGTDNIYSVLERHNAMNDLCTPRRDRIGLPFGGIINKISLLDFPQGNYVLWLNGRECVTAKYSEQTKLLEFDLSEKNPITERYSVTSLSNGESELINHGNYVNFDMIDVAKLYCENDLKLNDKHTICFHGYFNHNNKWTKSDHIFNIYPFSTYGVLSNYPTESFEIRTNKSGGTIILRLNGVELPMIKSTSELLKIKFNNPFRLFEMQASKYLSEEINKNVINFTGVDHIDIILIDCEIVELYQNYYSRYSYPERVKLQ
jgi:hypothetical protein